MANDPTIEFKGDASGVEAAGQATQQVLDSVRKKLQDLQNPLGAMARAWGQAFNIGPAATRAANDLDKIKNSAIGTKNEVSGLDKALRQLGTGVGIGLIVRQAQAMADAWTRSRNLIAAVGTDAQDIAGVQSELVKIAQDTRTALEPTVFLYSRMYRAVAPLGVEQERVARAVEITNKAFKAGGAAVSEQNNAILQLSQALGSGLLQGDELRSVRENAPLIAKAIADEFDTTIAGLKKLGEQGELTTDRVFKAIIEGGKDIDAQFAVTMPTISDGFTNLQTALIAFVGKSNEASGASLAVGAALNFVATNLDTLTQLAMAGAVAWGVHFVAAAYRASLANGGLAASLTLTSVRSALAATAATLTSRSFYTMATAATVARGALTLLLGPLGLAIAAGTGLMVLFGVLENGADSTRNWGAEIASTAAKLESLQAAADDFDDAKITRLGSSMEGMSQKTETAADRVERLADNLDRANAAAWARKMQEANEVIAETTEQLEELDRAFAKAQKWNWSGDAERLVQYNRAREAGNKRIEQAIALMQRLNKQEKEGQDPEAQKQLNEAIFQELEVRIFKARNNQAEELRLLREKANVAANIYGDESDEYMRAMKDMETARDKMARDAERAAKDQARAERDAQKDILEQYDLRLEMAEEDKNESIKIMDEKLAKLKEFYGEDSREYARGMQDKLRMLDRFAREELRVARENIRAEGDIRNIQLGAELTAQQNQFRMRESAIEESLDRGYINEVQAAQLKAQLRQQELQNELAHQNRIYQAALQTLQAQLDLEGMKPSERAKILGEIERLEAEHLANMAAINGKLAIDTIEGQKEVATEVQKSWQNILSPVQSSLSGMFRDLYNGTAGWRDAFLKVLDNILFSFVDMGIQMATKWAAQQLTMTAATTAGSTARTAAVATEAATTQSVSAGSALMQIMNNAWTAASGAYAALAGIPIVGPVLAPAAAATALGAVLAFAGRIFSAKGGFGKVPADGSITELHKDEMVLPADIASPLRSMLAQARGPSSPATLGARAGQNFTTMQSQTVNDMADRYGDTNFYYSPKYEGPDGSTSLSKMLRRDGRTMEKWLEGKFKGKKGKYS